MRAERRVALRAALATLAGPVLAGCAGPERAGAPPLPAPTYRVVDLMPEFWDFWARAQALPAHEQAALFQRLVVDRHRALYTPHVLGLGPDERDPAALARRFVRVQAAIAPHMALMRRISERIAQDLRRYEARFRRVFPDLAYRGDVVFMHSLGAFDGGTRIVEGREALLFGLDMIAYVYGEDADPEAFFHHELFHVYHAQATGIRNDRIATALWGEGLATHVAQVLNPRAPPVVLFGLPRSTPARVRADLPRLARALRERLDSTSREDYERFFTGSDERPDVPARAGYVVGWLVARTLAERHGLFELAHRPLASLRPEIEQALEAMEG